MSMISLTHRSTHKNGFLFIATILLALFTTQSEAARRTGGTTTPSPLTLQSQPSDTVLQPGTAVTFNIKASSSNKITYTWIKDGSKVGRSRSSYSISSATASDAGVYSCKVTDGITTVNCVPFTVTVQTADVIAPAPEPTPAPTSDLTLVTQPSSTTVYEGGSATFSLSATSSQSFSVSWLKNGAVIGSGNSLTISNATLNNAGTYSCRVSDAIKSIDCNSFTLTVNQIVRITQQPSSLMINEGSSANLSVTATGTAPISYQWYRNGSAINGATGNTLSLATTAGTDAGDYYCKVSNPGSSANSATATLSIVAVVKTGSAVISWQAPTTRADGSALSAADIAGYDLFYSEDGASMSKLTSLAAGELSVQVDDLALGTHYFALATKDVNGMQSTLSSTISVTIK